MATTLVVTNDFPPRIGGIERFVEQVCGFCDDDVVVLTSTEPGADGRPMPPGRTRSSGEAGCCCRRRRSPVRRPGC